MIFLALQIGATYAKIYLGFFQVAAIIILTIQVNQKYAESIERISFWLYFGVTAWTICLTIAVVIFVTYIAHCLRQNSSGGDTAGCYAATHTGVFLNGACFAILSLLLIVTVIPLFTSLNKLQKGRMELT